MRIRRGFTLIEIVVVISLIGVMFFLILSSVGKERDVDLLGIVDTPLYVNDLAVAGDSVFYIYGEKCDQAVLIFDRNSTLKLPSFGFDKNMVVLKRDNNGDIEELSFEDKRVAKKREKVCFRLEFKSGRFFDKLVLTNQTRHYLFNPLFQEVYTYDSLEKAKEAYEQRELRLYSIDGYHRE